MQTAVLWFVFLLAALLPFRLLALGKRGRRDPPPDPWSNSRPVRTPDPYVLPLPDPREARWRRWARRSRHPDRILPMPHPVDDPCWHRQTAARHARQFPSELRPHNGAVPDDIDVVRLYVDRVTDSTDSTDP